ncbi:T6SS effector BTH_I2691 family protein [Halomonas cupida]|uniref:T6SS effector BTH_I2691 family protein n=1 Tax=Halomonas cupida TaxID=44933 RepID=UPI003A91B928
MSGSYSDAREKTRAHSASRGESTKCPLCERKGLPILPVRLAVCERTDLNSAIPEVPASRVQELTGVTLDKSLVDGEKQSRTLSENVQKYYSDATGSSVTKYVLRQLRPGYLYILDDSASEPFNWFAYVVTPDGMFYQFSINGAPPAPEEAQFDCGGAPEEEKSHKALNASLVALPTVENEGKLYFAFTEHPWSQGHLNKLRTTPELRDQVMQEIDLKQWLDNQEVPYAFGVDDLSMVAEYSDGAAGMEHEFWPTQPERRLFSREDISTAMDHRLSKADDRYQGRGLILVVKDELGVIEELNAYRQQPLELMQEFLGEDGSDNRRQLTVMHAVEAFKENFRNTYLDSTALAEDETEYLENQDAAYDAGLSSIEARISEARANGDENALLRHQRDKEQYIEVFGWRNNALQRNTQSRMAQADNKLADFSQEMSDHYDEARLSLFQNGTPSDNWGGYNGRVEIIQQLVTALDEDYSFWVLEHLSTAAKRYSQEDADYYYGLGLSGLVASALSGGIYSSASVYLWSELAKDLDTESSPIGRALFGNMNNLRSRALQDCNSLSGWGYFDEARLKEWRSEFMSLRSRVENVAAEILEERYQESVSSLIEILGGSFSALAMGETALEVMKATAEGDGVSAEARKHGMAALPSLVRYLQLATMGQADMFEDSAELPIMERLHLKKKDYYAWLQSLPQQIDTVRRGHPRSQDSGAMHYPEGSGGNFSLDTLDGDGTLEIVVPVSMSLGFLDINTGTSDDASNDDQNKSADIARSSLKTAGDVLDAMQVHAATAKSLVTISAVIALSQEFTKTGENKDNLKIFGAFVAFVGAAMGLTEAIVKRRNQAVVGSGGMEWVFTSRRSWVISAKAAKYTGVFFSLYDTGNKLSAAETARKRGVPVEITGNYIQAAFSGIGIVTALVAGWPGLVLGLALALLAGYFASAYKALVPLACSTWLDRCFLRRVLDNSGRGWGQIDPFEDANHEMSSLDMVFRGVTVDLLWGNTTIKQETERDKSEDDIAVLPHMRAGTGTSSIASGYPAIAIQEELAGAVEGKKIKIEVTVPDLDRMELVLVMRTHESGNEKALFDYLYKKEREGEFRAISSSIIGVSEMGVVSKGEGVCKVSIEKDYENSSLYKSVSLDVSFFDKSGDSDRKDDSFLLRLV